MSINVQKIKEDFPLLKDGFLSYMDSAATSQTPTVVIEEIEKYYQEYRANVHRGLYMASELATEKYEEARAIVATFIGADVEEVIFTSGATMSSNMLILALEHSKGVVNGNTVVTTVMEHHASLLPLKKYAERSGKNVVEIGITDSKELNYEEIEEKINKDTSIVSVILASNVIGTINNIQKIMKKAHAVGAIIIVDATAAAGHMPIDVRKLDVDFLYFSGHKMCGPTGIGVLFGKKELLEKMEPGFYGGGMVSSLSKGSYKWVSGSERFEAGTPNIEGAIGLAAAINYLNKIGIRKIHELVTELIHELITELNKVEGVKIIAQEDEKKNIGIISFTVDGIHPHDIAQIAGERGVALRAGHHCAIPLLTELGVPATVRASLYFYNTKGDIKRLITVIEEAKTIFS